MASGLEARTPIGVLLITRLSDEHEQTTRGGIQGMDNIGRDRHGIWKLVGDLNNITRTIAVNNDVVAAVTR